MKPDESIKRVVLKWRRAYCASAVINFFTGVLPLVFGFFIIVTLFDSAIYLKSGVRKIFFFSFCFFLVFKVFKGAKNFLPSLKLENFSPEIEKKAPLLLKYIGPAINFILNPKLKNASRVFVGEHLKQTYERVKACESLRFSPFDFENFKFKLLGSFCLAVGFAWLWMTNPLAAQRAVFPFLGDEIENIMTISPGNATIVEGGGAKIKVSWKKESSLMPGLQIKEGKGPWISVDWDKQSFLSREYDIKNIKHSLNYKLKHRTMESRVYRLNVRRYPEIENINFTVTRPEYLGYKRGSYSYIPARLSAIEASKISIEADVSGAASEIIMRVKDGKNEREKKLFKDSSGRFSAVLNAFENTRVEFEAVAGDGLVNPMKTGQEITVVKDMPPSVDILSPLFEVEMPQGEGIKIIYRADDDFGLSAVSLRAEFRLDGKMLKEHEFLKNLEVFEKKDIKEFVGEKYVFMPVLADEFEAYLRIRVSDNFPIGEKKSRWTESLPIKIRVKNFQKAHNKALSNLSDMKRSLADMAKFEKDAAFEISGGSAPFKNADFIKRWKTLNKLSAEVLSSLKKDPYFNEGLKNEYEILDEDIKYMADVLVKKAVQEFDKGDYKNSASIHKSMASFLKRGLKKVGNLLNMQGTKDIDFKAGKWESAVSRINSALSGENGGKKNTELWNDFSKIMKDISMEMSELSKMLSDSKYDESLDVGKKFQIPMNTASGLAEKLRDALESGNLQDALEAAKNLLEQIKKTRRVLEEYSDFAASMENNGEKMDELLKVKELWNELRDSEAETFSENTGFMDELVIRVNLKREDILKQVFKSSAKIVKISKTSSTPGVEIKLIGKISSTPGVEEVGRWRESLKRSLDSLKKSSESLKNPEIEKLTKEINFSLVLSSGIEKDLRFFDSEDKAFFIDFADKQGLIIQSSRPLEEKIESMKSEFLSFSFNLKEKLFKAIVEMTAAEADLEKFNMKGALKHQIKALEELDLGKDMMEKAAQKRANISAAKKSAGGGFKEGRAGKPGAFGAGHSGGGLDKSGVKLPEDGVYRSSKEIREKVLESLGEKYPKKSKKMILDYLRKISE